MRGSRRQYAAHRKELGLTGTSHVAVGKAIDSGRIKEGEDGLIDFEESDRLWAANTTPAGAARNPSGVKKQAEEPPPREKPRPEPQTQTTPQPDGTAGVSLVKAQTMRAVFSAQREKLKFEEESGKKVDRDEIRVNAFNRARRARDMLLSAPARIAPLLIGLTDVLQITMILEDEFRRVAEGIAGDVTKSV